MTLKEDIIKANSDKVYALMGNGRYTFTYLQEKSQLESSDLCIALLILIRDNRIRQQNDGKVYYSKVVM